MSSIVKMLPLVNDDTEVYLGQVEVFLVGEWKDMKTA